MSTNALQKTVPGDDEDEYVESAYLKAKKAQFAETLHGYDEEDCNCKFNTLYSLIQLYSITNLQVI